MQSACRKKDYALIVGMAQNNYILIDKYNIKMEINNEKLLNETKKIERVLKKERKSKRLS